LAGEFSIDDEGGLLLLATVCESFDRMKQAQQVLKTDGLVQVDRFGQPKPHPAAVIERDSRSGMLQALKALNLDVAPLHDRVGRPGG
jgi:P27 family predicted phage terminase small subunit